MAKGEIKLPHVTSLSVKYFKGIADEQTIEFTKNNKIVVLLGENGTGKSSFVNAFEYLFKKKLDILRPITVDNKSYIHKGHSEKEWEIKLNLGHEFIKLNGNGCDASNLVKKAIRNNKSFFDNASFILNRKKLLEFIDNSEGERFNKFSSLCGLEEIEKIQKTFNSVENSFEKDLKSKKEKLNSLMSNIDDTVEINNENDLIKLINENLISLNKEEINENTDLNEFLDSLSLSSEAFIVEDNINQFMELNKNIDLSKASEEYGKLLEDYEQIGLDSITHLKNMSDILISSKKYFIESNSEICPVCGNNVDETILDELENKLSKVNKSLLNFNDWKNSVNEFISSLNVVKSQYSNLLIILKNLSKYLDLTNEINFIEENKRVILDLTNDLNDLVEVKISILELNNKYDLNVENELNLINDKLIEYNNAHFKGENLKKLRDTKDLINKLISFKDLNNELNLLNRKYELSCEINDSFKETKETYVKNLIEEIEDDVVDFYKIIHGDDLIISPSIEQYDTSKLRLYLNSFGEPTDPRSYSSEGHLDTLGLCIFLAFMKRHNPLKLIVLDDVIMSVDLSHKDKVAKLLVSEFEDYRILITTHNGLWANQLRRIGAYYKNQVNVLQITNWDIAAGPYIRKSKKIDEKINEYLDNGDFNAAGNASRRYLEFTLCEFCENHPVKIQLNDKYMVSDLYNAVHDESLDLVSENEELTKFFEHVWGELKMYDYIGNKLSHNNKDSFLLTGSEIRPFCKSVCELNDALKCCNCKYNDKFVFYETINKVSCAYECSYK